MQLFYSPDSITGSTIALSEEESTHCTGVLRYKEGDNITITDGKGNMYDAVIEKIAKRQVYVSVLKNSEVDNDRHYRVHIAIAPTKNIERFEWFLEKATEIGIDEITPLITENSERRVIRTDRLNKILISAMKQSLKSYLPILNPISEYNTFIGTGRERNQLFIAHCDSANESLLKNEYKKGNDTLILIGPEGDFSNTEVRLAITNGYIPVSLGKSRLRTETAGIVACHTLFLMNQ